ncbi:NAD(P)/FAD-dependent oxidoreductase [Actinomadura rugatobispora]|uniref:NAD(P)/FAD-dependent oxidoreductase n=1 Tax=Actinomadura rugatobispora TaxID=1994 RepID=A0ABW1ACS5_9ACTN|nr:FAD-binding oxidoreductase [Actinomadura rugatobispora]
MRVAVIGAGVVGAAVAAGLTRRGAEVVLLDRDVPGAGTTATTIAWINSNNKDPDHYFAFNHAGVRAHHALAAGGGDWFVPTGSLEVAASDEHRGWLAERVAKLRSRAYPVRYLTADEVRELEPDLVRPDGADYAFFPEEAHAHPIRLLARFLGEARDGGARVETGAEVREIASSPSGVTLALAGGRTLTADVAVTCAGRWTQEVAASAGLTVPMLDPRVSGPAVNAYLGVTAPIPARLSRHVTTGRLNLRPDGGGRIMLHALDLDATADPAAEPAPAIGTELLSRLPGVLAPVPGARLERLVVGQRAMPADGLTVAGFADGHARVYVVATHSGITLSALLAEEVAAEVHGAESAWLRAYRPTRFAAGGAGPASVPPRWPGEQ